MAPRSRTVLPSILICVLVVAACASGGGGGVQAGGRPPVAAEGARPIPYPVSYPLGFQRAIEKGTRTTTGEPGPRYWQQWTDYDLAARVFPEEKRIEGDARIVYCNASPDTLRQLHVELVQNVHAPGAVRNLPEEVTGGVELARVRVAGQDLPRGANPDAAPPDTAGLPAEGPRYVVQGTDLVLVPPSPVAPGDSVELELAWGFRLAQQGASGRMGWSRDNLLYLAYWYPQMHVYDDVVGWHTEPFRGLAEFYSGFGNYRYTVEAPQGWVVLGTGRLENAEEVLAAPVLERLRRAESSDDVVQVLGEADFGSATKAEDGAGLSWHFRADSVRDVAFSLTRESVWDAARTPVGDRDGDGKADYTRVDALYRDTAPRWENVARYAQHAVRFLSGFTGVPYPWPHMSVVEAADIIGGGMEFPMMTIIGDYNARGDSALYNVTVHEIGHMWVPMTVAPNERRFSWLDEGVTEFNEGMGRLDFFPGSDPLEDERQGYVAVVDSGLEVELMRPSDLQSDDAFTIASYNKPALLLGALRGVLGEETFLKAYREFFQRWKGRHPYPWDLFNTFEDVSGRDLDWFWSSWYGETWTLDHAVGSVTTSDGETRIVIEDRGLVPMPAQVTVTFANGEVLERVVPVETWLSGARTATVTLPEDAAVTRVEIDSERAFPDVNRENNVWESGG